MKAVKKNRVYTIQEVDVKRFVAQGYDIYDDAGNCVAYGAGKTVPFIQYKKALDEIARLEAMVAEFGAKPQVAEEPVEAEAETEVIDEPKKKGKKSKKAETEE